MNREDVRAVIELTCEQWHMPISSFSLVKSRGHAVLETGHISIPRWALRDYGEPFAIYYICHELAHVKMAKPKHTIQFKRIEALMMEPWGVTAGKYNGSYPKKEAVAYGPNQYPKTTRL